MNQAARDAEIMVRERSKKSRRMQLELNELFARADVSNDGAITLDEMQDLMQLPKVQLWLSELGIDASDTRALFDLIDGDGSGAISRNEFLLGMTKLKGEARAQDLVPLVTMSKRILEQVKDIFQTSQDIAAAMAMRAEQTELQLHGHGVQKI